MKDESTHPVAGVGRRFAAMIYDALLLIALWAVTTFAFLPLTGGEYVESGGPLIKHVYQAALILVWVGFYGLFWTRSGQTLGMLAWRLKLVCDSGEPVRWRDVVARLAAGVVSFLPALFGFFWLWFDREHLTWHDRLSHTRPIVLPKRAK
ncbi:MAG: RDD family protein [Steroidobacteraceae bacterium]